MSHLFAHLARMKLIQRWPLMYNVRTENVQEHSLQVAMVAHALAGWPLVLGQRVFAWARRTPYLTDLPRDVAVLSFVAFAVALGPGGDQLDPGVGSGLQQKTHGFFAGAGGRAHEGAGRALGLCHHGEGQAMDGRRRRRCGGGIRHARHYDGQCLRDAERDLKRTLLIHR